MALDYWRAAFSISSGPRSRGELIFEEHPPIPSIGKPLKVETSQSDTFIELLLASLEKQIDSAVASCCKR